MTVTIGVVGAAGRMGMRLVALAQQDTALKVVAAIERGDHPALSRDAGEVAGVGAVKVPITSDLRDIPQVLIDFSSPGSMRHWLKVCRDRGIAMLIGTTGLQPADLAAIEQAGADIPILQAPNMSLGVAVLFKLAADAARLLGPDYDIEIVEAHHRFKKDAPSGTAEGLEGAIRRETAAQRTIGMHSLRMGDEVGKHTAYFAALGERLEFTHVATNRDTFVHGALRAAKWLAGKRAGRYTIADVLGL